MNIFEQDLTIRGYYIKTGQLGCLCNGNDALYFDVERVEAHGTPGINCKQLDEHHGTLNTHADHPYAFLLFEVGLLRRTDSDQYLYSKNTAANDQIAQ